MIIKLSPVRSDAGLSVVKSGDILEVNAVALDFSCLADGATLPGQAVGCEFVIGPVERINGELVLTLMLPHAADASPAARFPVDLYPADGQVQLPGLELGERLASTAGVIDWSQAITAEAKVQAAADQLLATVTADLAQRRAVADAAIAPLQDAVELEEATEAEVALLREWKRYRLTLIRLPEQEGYPTSIDWPASPA
ncbi:tail fiber assembly protein [Pseudomonas sp. NyZ480]|uniref:tail fiber assembly protein n=1 Tax=Pseudomonas sp. NyZ480 TaxID=3035289 RepID=UPI002409A0B7|nr:tail fiber assembly protein [Pseudomonas sp. NyZ480]WEZ90470.1 tail fiber assembly protein [Pseudomonas sp. NyZ480]